MPLEVRSRIRAMELPPFDPLNQRAAELRADGHHVISLGQAVPYFAPPETARAAAADALHHGNGELHRYASDPGLVSLREALAAQLARGTGHAIAATDLLISAGGNHAFTLVLQTIVDAGDEVILPGPWFTNHQMAVVAVGATVVEAPIADRVTFALRWTDIEPHLTPRTRAVILCNPSNPTGAPIDPHEGRRIVSELARRGIFVVSDETYMQFVYDGEHWSAASAPNWRENVIVIGTFSKCFGMMGWRVGFVLADAAIVAEIVKVQDAMIICAPVISQIAAEAAVRGSWDYARSFHGELRRRRQVLRERIAAIPRLSWSPTGGGLFAFARVDGCDDSTRLSLDLLERAQVVTIPGAAFGPSGEGHLRLSYGYAHDADLIEATRRLGEFLA